MSTFPVNPDSDDEAASETTPAEESPSALRNIMLTIAYDGTAYRGWQVQPNGLSVQECVERAVQRLTGESPRVFCAGRTDAGVHAIGQVANFRSNCRIPIENIRRGLQCFLPEDITVVCAADVAPGFHATYSAIKKRYRYVICDSDVAPPFLNRFAHRCRFHLDVDLMAEATRHLLGTHDFRCFETQYPNKSSSVRNIMEATIQRIDSWEPWSSPHNWNPVHGRPYQNFDRPIIAFEVMADGFLYNMVRAIVGTLMEVGRGKYEPQFVRHIIQSQDRSRAGITAPAQGLYLVKVDYPELLLRPEIPWGS